jgi:hypothetical protein
MKVKLLRALVVGLMLVARSTINNLHAIKIIDLRSSEVVVALPQLGRVVQDIKIIVARTNIKISLFPI